MISTRTFSIFLSGFFFLSIFTSSVFAQDGVLIDYVGSTRDASAVLDVRSGSQGVMVPRVTLSATNNSSPITSPATSLLVYNTTASGSGATAVQPGYYYWSGTGWVRLMSGNAAVPTGSGTLDYLARWTPDGATLGTGITRDNGTSVGIGVAPNAANRLQVSGLTYLFNDLAEDLRVGRDANQHLSVEVQDNHAYLDYEQDSDANGSHVLYIRNNAAGTGENSITFHTSAAERLTIADNGTIRVPSLASSDDIVIANASGDLSTISSLVGTGLGDNLGDHTATQNVELNGNWLSNDGGNEGIKITNGGNVSVIGTGTIGGSSGNLANSHLLVGTSTLGLGMDSNELYFKGIDGNFGVIGANKLTVNVNGASRMEVESNGNTSFNQSGVDSDFRVESDDNTNMLFVDGGNDRVGIGTGSPAQALDVAGHIRGTSYYQDDNSVTRVINPTGASFYDSGGSTGAIQIEVPPHRSMITVTAKVFNYTNDESFTVVASGYVYPPNPGWVNTSAQIIGTNPNTDVVRFGHTGATNFYILIGETNTTWSYVHAAVTEVTVSYSAQSIANWGDGWNITQVTSLPTIDRTISDATIMAGDKWTLNGTDLYPNDNGWDVGIGTASPDANLDVAGDVILNSDNSIQKRRITTINRNVAQAAGSYVQLGSITSNGKGTYVNIHESHHNGCTINSGFFEILDVYYSGTTTDWMQVPVQNYRSYSGSQDFAIDVRRTGNHGSANLEIRYRSLGGACATTAAYFEIQTNGTFTAATGSGGGATVAGYLGSTGYQFPVSNNRFAASEEGIFIENTGEVGIGTSTPTPKVEINGVALMKTLLTSDIESIGTAGTSAVSGTRWDTQECSDGYAMQSLSVWHGSRTNGNPVMNCVNLDGLLGSNNTWYTKNATSVAAYNTYTSGQSGLSGDDDGTDHEAECPNGRVATGFSVYARGSWDSGLKLRCRDLISGVALTHTGEGFYSNIGNFSRGDNLRESAACPTGTLVKSIRVYAHNDDGNDYMDGRLRLYCTGIKAQ